jgi:hypothetical protein
VGEVAFIAWIVVLATDDFDTMFEPSDLDEMQVHRQENASADEQDEERRTPDDTPHKSHAVVEICENLVHSSGESSAMNKVT